MGDDLVPAVPTEQLSLILEILLKLDILAHKMGHLLDEMKNRQTGMETLWAHMVSEYQVANFARAIREELDRREMVKQSQFATRSGGVPAGELVRQGAGNDIGNDADRPSTDERFDIPSF